MRNKFVPVYDEQVTILKSNSKIIISMEVCNKESASLSFSIPSTTMSFGRVLCVFFVICAVRAQVLADQESRVVQTTSGSVRGYKEDDLYIFYSIPYATAPTGRDKFKVGL